MIAAIMQPYFFPYIGYFQLLRAVDVFVAYDDVQYMKGGWVNRNRILLDDQPSWITLPVRRAGLTPHINQRQYQPEGKNKDCIKKKLHEGYSKAPHYKDVFRLVCELLEYPDDNVASFNIHLLRTLANWMDLDCKFLVSSEMDQTPDLKGQDRVIDICTRLGADRYINPIGGIELYDTSAFAARGIELCFLRSTPPAYQQFRSPHVPFLSVIDVLMFNPKSRVKSLLSEYELVPGHKPESP